jgi:AbrB family looped-hinge helix DNA binding protein
MVIPRAQEVRVSTQQAREFRPTGEVILARLLTKRLLKKARASKRFGLFPHPATTRTDAHYHGNIWMSIARSKITAQGQISIPADVRRKLGVGPGSVLEWDEADGKILVRRAGRFSSHDIHKALFGTDTPAARSLDELKEGIRSHVRQRYARA